MFRAVILLLLLSACAASPQKSLSPVSLGTFETALVETGDDAVARSVAHIVDVNGQHGLVVYLRRKDGGPVAVTRASSGGVDLPYEHVTLANGVTGGLILHTRRDMARAATHGLTASLCGASECYRVNVPATLYQQALLE